MSFPVSSFWAAYREVLEQIRYLTLPRGYDYAVAHRDRWHHAFRLFEQVCIGPCRVLDIGASPFSLILRSLRSDDELYVVDLIEDWKESLEHQHISFQRCDLTGSSIPLPDDFVDAVFCCEVIEHLQVNPVRILRELRRTLRPSGIVILQTPNLVRHTNRIRFSAGKSPMHIDEDGIRYPRHWREYTRSELQTMASLAGFVTLSASYERYNERGYETRFLSAVAETAATLIPSLSSGIAMVLQKPAGGEQGV